MRVGSLIEIPEVALDGARGVEGAACELAEYRAKCQDDRFWLAHEARIRDRSEALVPLWPLTSGQMRLQEDKERQEGERGYVRKAVAKGRRLGISTWSAATSFRWVMKRGGLAVVIAHTDESTLRIFRMVHRLYENMTPELRPQCVNDRMDDLRFLWPDGREVQFSVSTAGSPESLRGAGCQALWLSEAAFYERPELVAASALNTVPDGLGLIIIETTANGATGWWPEFVNLCREGKNDYALTFTCCLEDPSCRRVASADESEAWRLWKEADAAGRIEERALYARALDMDESDEDAVRTSGMALEQYAWWRARLTDGAALQPGVDPRLKRRQEHPLTLEESFLSSGRAVFPPEQMAKQERAARLRWGEVRRWEVSKANRDVDWPGSWTVRENPYGRLQVIDPPRAGVQYVVSIDAEEGLEEDRSAGHVFTLEANRMEQVARWDGGSVDPVELADIMGGVAWWYNEAFAVIEAASGGLVIIAWFRDILQYPSMYMRERFDEREKKVALQYGFKAGQGEKRIAIAELQRLLREGQLILNFPETIDQFRKYQRFPNGKLAKPHGGRDDEVDAARLAAIGRRPEEFRGHRPKREPLMRPGPPRDEHGRVVTVSERYAEWYMRRLGGDTGQTIFGRIR